MLRVIGEHRGCTVASYTKDTKKKLAQAMNKVHNIKLSLVQICFLHFHVHFHLRSLPPKSVSRVLGKDGIVVQDLDHSVL